MAKPILLLDGKFMAAPNGLLNNFEPGCVKGKGVFESMLFDKKTIFFLPEHLKRLKRGLKFLKIQCPMTKRQFKQRLYQVLKLNRLKKARVRLMVWKDKHAHMSIVIEKYQPVGKRKYHRGFRGATVRIKAPLRKDPSIKSIDYKVFQSVFKKAKERGFDEAILINNKNEVVEGSRTNIFFVKNKILYTPSLACGGLKGIIRDIVLQSAKADGIPCLEKKVKLREIQQFEEAFLTNSLIGVMPLTFVDGKKIGEGKKGVMTDYLMKRYELMLNPNFAMETRTRRYTPHKMMHAKGGFNPDRRG